MSNDSSSGDEGPPKPDAIAGTKVPARPAPSRLGVVPRLGVAGNAATGGSPSLPRRQMPLGGLPLASAEPTGADVLSPADGASRQRDTTGRFPSRLEPSGKHPTLKFCPGPPRTLEETGLSSAMVEELVLKALFFAGELRGADLTARVRLPQVILSEVIENLRKQKFIDMKGGAAMGVGKSTMTFTLTTYATELLRQILDRNRYNGPAPVPLDEWFKAVKKQTVRGMRITRDKMKARFSDLVMKEDVLDGLGPALNSGKAIFFYGPPGNGKSAICRALVNCYEGDIYVPHALLVDDFIIRVFDATLHEEVAEEPDAPATDTRWVRCRRPLVIVGGELTLKTLDLIYTSEVKFYEAPFQLKATNGMLLIDDFGRQLVTPKDLLNRWIVPLESEVDYLTLHTGKKLQVPFDVFVAFATNLDPTDLVDDAFLRRVRYKLAVNPPDLEQYVRIWKGVCQTMQVAYDAKAIDWLVATHYKPHGRQFAACQPRDLLAQVIDNAHYRGEAPALTRELLALAVKNYFVDFAPGPAPG